MNEQVWIVGKDMMEPPHQEGPCDNWELQGVFASQEEAVAACLASGEDRYFVFPHGFAVGEMLADETVLVECLHPVYDARQITSGEPEKEETT